MADDGVKLLDCPFCNGAPFLDNLSESGTDRYSWYVRCTICEIQQIVNNGSRAQAIALWNKRALSSSPDERMREALQKLCDAIQAQVVANRGAGHENGGISIAVRWHRTQALELLKAP